MRILNGDNLQILKSLEGERFDLAELDGPYMAGLEGWDILTEAEYIQHYAERLTALRPLLQPWGVVFVFGYPEGVAEIKSWAHRADTLSCRRGSARGSASAPLHTMARDCRASAGRGQTSQCAGFARSMFSCERDAKFDCSDE